MIVHKSSLRNPDCQAEKKSLFDYIKQFLDGVENSEGYTQLCIRTIFSYNSASFNAPIFCRCYFNSDILSHCERYEIEYFCIARTFDSCEG
jgi:hypothetical protein